MPDAASPAAADACATGRSSASSPPGPAVPALTRPRLKKSRTIAGTDAAAAVPAVRRLPTTPASSSSSSPPHRAFADFASDAGGGGDGMGDRDWYYPSFLGAGPHASRARSGAKAARPPKPGPPPLPPPRQPRTPPRSESVNHAAPSSPPAAAAGPSTATASTRLVAEKRKLDPKVDIARTSSGGTPPQAMGKKKGRFDGSLVPLVVNVLLYRLLNIPIVGITGL